MPNKKEKAEEGFKDQVIKMGNRKVLTVHAPFLKQTGIKNPNKEQMRFLLEEISKLFVTGEAEGVSSGEA